MLEGKHIILRAMEYDDAIDIIKWRNATSSKDKFFSFKKISSQEQLEWMKKHMFSQNEFNWIIEEKTTLAKVGTLALENIDYRNGNAEYVRLIIEEKFREKGFAYEAEVLMLEYAFNYLRLNKVFCKTFLHNEAINKLHLKTGFIEVGKMRKHIFLDGEYKDILIYEILREDYEKMVSNTRKP